MAVMSLEEIMREEEAAARGAQVSFCVLLSLFCLLW
jgi:hypothetical protein